MLFHKKLGPSIDPFLFVIILRFIHQGLGTKRILIKIASLF
jgi:hypothetical protein